MQKTMTANIRNYNSALLELDESPNGTVILPGRDTKLVILNPEADIAVNYRGTNVVIYRANGDIMLDAGNWLTRTTRNLMNKYLPEDYIVVDSKLGVWQVVNKLTDAWVAFTNKMIIRANGTMRNDSMDSIQSVALIPMVDAYMKEYMRLVESQQMPDQKSVTWVNENALMDKDRCLKMIKSEVYPPELLVAAVNMYANSSRHFIVANEVTETPKAWWTLADVEYEETFKAFRRYLRRYLNLSLGLPV